MKLFGWQSSYPPDDCSLYTLLEGESVWKCLLDGYFILRWLQSVFICMGIWVLFYLCHFIIAVYWKLTKSAYQHEWPSLLQAERWKLTLLMLRSNTYNQHLKTSCSRRMKSAWLCAYIRQHRKAATCIHCFDSETGWICEELPYASIDQAQLMQQMEK